MIKYKMVVFDLDGTILNTIKDLNMAVNAALNEYNLPIINVEQTKKYLGYGIKHLIKMASNDNGNVDELLHVFKCYYKEHYNDFTKPYDGIEDVFEYCRENNIIIGVLTNKIEMIAKPLCDEHFPNVFSFIYGEIEGRKRKPDPEMILKLLKEYNIKNDEFLYIGDSEVDIEVANNALVDSIACTYGFRDKKILLSKYPNKEMVDRPLDIIKFLS